MGSGEAYLDFANMFVEVFAFPFRVFVIYIGRHFAVEVCTYGYNVVGVFDDPVGSVN